MSWKTFLTQLAKETSQRAIEQLLINSPFVEVVSSAPVPTKGQSTSKTNRASKSRAR